MNPLADRVFLKKLDLYKNRIKNSCNSRCDLL